MWYFVSLYLQQVLRLDPLEAGLSFLPMTPMIIIFSQLARGRRAGSARAPSSPSAMASLGAGMLLLSQASRRRPWLGDVLGPSLLTAAGIGARSCP